MGASVSNEGTTGQRPVWPRSALVELAKSSPADRLGLLGAEAVAPELPEIPGVLQDRDFGRIRLHARNSLAGSTADTEVMRAIVDSPAAIALLRSTSEVIEVWADPAISAAIPNGLAAVAGVTADQIAASLGVDKVRRYLPSGPRSVGIGIVDAGIDRERVQAPVVNGWSPPGTGGVGASDVEWGDHGSVCARVALIACPGAVLYDYGFMRLANQSDEGALSNALLAFEKAIADYHESGRPMVLSCSWAAYSRDPDADLAAGLRPYWNDPQHPFTKMVVRAIEEGLIVVFMAGNCGAGDPNPLCGVGDIGPGCSILGANGHSSVLCVGAVDAQRNGLGSSSQGPSRLNAAKPDVCCYSDFHLPGNNAVSLGTSTAAALTAGVAALLCAIDPGLNQAQLNDLLRSTAQKPEGFPAGWDCDLGFGVVDAWAACQKITASRTRTFRSKLLAWLRDLRLNRRIS